MAYWKLKKGSHSVGRGITARYLRANSENNVLESEVDMAERAPDKWEALKGRPEGVNIASDKQSLSEGKNTPEEMRRQAQELLRQADEAESRAPRQTAPQQQEQPEVTRPQESEKQPQRPQPQQPQPQKAPQRPPQTRQEAEARLKDMTVEELREVAEEEEIELRSGMRKEEVIQAILKGK